MNRMNGARSLGVMSGTSEQLFEPVRRDLCGFQNLLQRAGFDAVMERNDHKVFVVSHRDMFDFAEDIEAGAFEGSHDTFMRDLWQLRHTLTSTVRSFLRRFRSSMLSR